MGNQADKDLQALTGEESLAAAGEAIHAWRQSETPPETQASIEDAYLAAVREHTVDEEDEPDPATIWVHLDGTPCDHVGAGSQGGYYCRNDPSRVVVTRTRYEVDLAHGFATHLGQQIFDHAGIGSSIEDYTLPGMSRDALTVGRTISARGFLDDPGKHRRVDTVRSPLLNDDDDGPVTPKG